MKHPSEPEDDTDARAWVRDGLRALREQEPSEQSRRAALARLGIAPEPAGRGEPSRRSTAGVLARWLTWGLLLGLVLVLLRRSL